MSAKQRTPSTFQRNALAPGLLAGAVLFTTPLWTNGGLFQVVLFVTAILAAIVAWFAGQARQWWWIPVFVAVLVLWNPVVPFPFTGPIWAAAQPAAAIVFLIAGALIKVRRT
ncbi:MULTISPECIES: DUF6804 family protein [unclassified Microbacterium]|uniref:DUF6804 family protein n=1 Tax=unclassified Microbacterium TaxID=2609290 RepID=UPI00230582FB|nr:DUF6804 family protein [Microbacterium sp. nov. GSS16]WCD93052.1 hypothetical protein PGB26_01880 [Microbacterium sp. nov. GSS16]